MPRRRRTGARTPLIPLAAALCALAASGAGAGLPARGQRPVLGGTAEVRVAGAPDAGAALDDAFAALRSVEDAASLLRESELTRLDDAGRAAPGSSTLRALVLAALDVGRASGGAFDPTVEPLERARRGPGGRPRRLLASCEQKALRRVIGLEHVRVTPEGVLLDPGTRLDLDGVAPGFGVERALDALRARGASSGLVIAGSSTAVFGEPTEVELRDPRAEARPWGRFTLRDAAQGSAGGSGRPVLDPRTLRPAKSVLAASVVAQSAMEAQALGAAAFVLGADAGLALLQRRGADGLVLLHAHGRRTVRTTPGFAERYSLRLEPGVSLAR